MLVQDRCRAAGRHRVSAVPSAGVAPWHGFSRSRSRPLSRPLLFLASLLLAGCAGMTNQEQRSRIYDAQLAPESACCNNFPISEGAPATPETEGAAAPEEVVGRALARSERKVIDQRGRLPELKGPQPAAVTEGGGKPDDKLVLNYEQADLRAVLDDLAEILGINLLISTPIAGSVTFRTDPEHNLLRSDVWPLFRLLLANSGLTLVKRKDFYEVTKSSGSALDGIMLQGRGEASDVPMVTQITPLRYIDAANAIELLSPIVEGNGRITAVNNLNMLAITAPPDRIQQINSLIGVVDADPFQNRGIRLFYLHSANAEAIAKELETVIGMIEGERGTYQVQALSRINALLVVAPPLRGFKQVKKWVEILDESGRSQSEQMFIYKVKSLNAEAMAKTLTEVFKQDDKTQVPTLVEERKTRLEPKRTLPAAANEIDMKKKKSIEKTDVRTKTLTGVSRPRSTGNGVSADLNFVIVADKDTNSLLVRATPRDYQQLLGTISLLDQPPLEAVINVIIAQVTLNSSSSFGIDWNYVWNNAGSLIGTGFNVPNALTSTSGQSVGLVINSKGGDVTAVLNALASNNKVDVLSRPTILVKNNQEASIKVGANQPFITAQKQTQDAGVVPVIANDVSYRDTGIELTVTPHINDEGIIHLEIDQRLSAVGQTSAVPGFPSFDNQQIKTEAVVADRSMIVIGGLIETVKVLKDEFVPIVGAIPVIGAAFGTTKESTIRKELVLMIVPEIIKPNGGEAYYKAFRKRVKYAAAMLEDSFAGKDTVLRKPIPEQIRDILIPDR